MCCADARFLPRFAIFPCPGSIQKPPALHFQHYATVLGNDRRAEAMGDRADPRADIALLVDCGRVNRGGIHRCHQMWQLEPAIAADAVGILAQEPARNSSSIVMRPEDQKI